jgi:hypothetical protein
MLLTKQEIIEVLKSDYNGFTELGLDVVGIFAFGSYNYGVETEKSDIDVKLICKEINEDCQEFFFRQEPEGQIMIYSLDDFVEAMATNMPEWYEVLYTDLYFVPLKYRALWKQIWALRDSFFQETKDRLVLVTIKDLAQQMFTLAIREEDAPRENKRLSHILRFQNLITRLQNGESYPDILTVPNDLKQEIISLKLEAPLSIKKCRERSMATCRELEDKMKKYVFEQIEHSTSPAYEKIKALMLSIKEEGDDKQL